MLKSKMNNHLVIAIGSSKTFDFYSKSTKNLAGMDNSYISFEKDIREGNWVAVNEFLNSNPEAQRAKFSIRECTALHIAIFNGRMKIVELLLEKMKEEDLKITDIDGYTVLGTCALVGNIEMAKLIIVKSRTLLSIENGNSENRKVIPVVLALALNSNGIKIARYLYSKTPPEDLMPPGKIISGATLINRAIYSKAFGKNLRFNYIYSRCHFYALKPPHDSLSIFFFLRNDSLSINCLCLEIDRYRFRFT